LVLWENQKRILYFRVFMHFYDPIFWNLLRGYMRCTPPPPCVHLCYYSIISPWHHRLILLILITES
jgi:hypothetical protein